MNRDSIVKRRDFFKKTSRGIALITLLEGVGAWKGLGADGAEIGDSKNKAALEKVLREMETKGGKFLNVQRKDGQFLSLLVKATRAKNVLELGTSHGYSALWISSALQETGGKLTTIEILPERVQLAKKHLAESGLSDRVTFKEGDAHEIVPGLEEVFDLVFLNADKEGQVDYFNKLFPKKLQPGGIVMAYKAIRFRDSMKDFLDLIDQHPNFDSVILSVTMEDGFSVSYRRRS